MSAATPHGQAPYYFVPAPSSYPVQTAFGLLDFGAHLGVVGYTPKAVEVRLSNLMAFDATAASNWGCPPDRYPDALALVLDGKVRLDAFVETHPLDCAPSVFQSVIEHRITRRAILTRYPDERPQPR